MIALSFVALSADAFVEQMPAAKVSDEIPDLPRAQSRPTSSIVSRFERAEVPDLVPDDITPYEVLVGPEPTASPTAASTTPAAPAWTTTSPPLIGAPPPARQPASQPQEEPVPDEPEPTTEPAAEPEPTTEPEPTAEPTSTETPATPTDDVVVVITVP
jgi:hypothetical protein